MSFWDALALFWTWCFQEGLIKHHSTEFISELMNDCLTVSLPPPSAILAEQFFNFLILRFRAENKCPDDRSQPEAFEVYD